MKVSIIYVPSVLHPLLFRIQWSHKKVLGVYLPLTADILVLGAFLERMQAVVWAGRERGGGCRCLNLKSPFVVAPAAPV